MAEGTGNDGFALLREAETNAANFDLDTEGIIAHLQTWQKRCSFRITGADYDTVELEFDTLPKDIDAFVADIYEFCPDLVDQGTACAPEMIEMAEETGEEIPPEMKEVVQGIDFSDQNYGLEILKRELLRDKKLTLWWD